MRIFVSAGEPSGDLHGANLIRALRQKMPDAEFVGFGGPRMTGAGCRLLYPLCQLSFMWFRRIVRNIFTFLRLVYRADRCFRDERPDAVVLIDYPGFHWWLARRAHRRGIPVYYFVPPQLWAWAGWRVRKMRRYVDRVLCALPFEERWYRERDVPAQYVGHPYFDELHRQVLDAEFIAEQRQRQGRVVAILPGSRMQEVTDNLPTLIRAADLVALRHPDVHFHVAAFDDRQKQYISDFLNGSSLPIAVHCGRTPEIIALATACMSVSGSVGLELLFALLPSVVLYRVDQRDMWWIRQFMTARWISLVNLLAEEELFPEFLSPRCEAAAISEHVCRWLSDSTASESLRNRLRELKDRVAKPGACARAAEEIVSGIGAVAARRRAA
jgi:lipid-A-disaccharide synthase